MMWLVVREGLAASMVGFIAMVMVMELEEDDGRWKKGRQRR